MSDGSDGTPNGIYSSKVGQIPLRTLFFSERNSDERPEVAFREGEEPEM